MHGCVNEKPRNFSPLISKNWIELVRCTSQGWISSCGLAEIRKRLADDLSAELASGLIARDCNCIRRLIALSETTKKGIVAAEYANTLGILALFAREFFCQLKRLESETGAKQII